MYSETLDVGVTHPWLRLPDEVYSQVQLSNYEGADALYTLPTGIGSVTLQVAGGQAAKRNLFAMDDLYDIDYKKIFAANVSLETYDFGTLRVGYAEADIDTDLSASVVALGSAHACRLPEPEPQERPLRIHRLPVRQWHLGLFERVDQQQHRR